MWHLPPSNLQKWRICQSRMVLDNPWCRVRQDAVQLPDGTLIDDYFVNVRPEIVMVLAVTPQQEIIFVRQYRHGVQEILLELPAGTFFPDQESPTAAIRRELEEETGYQIVSLLNLGSIYDNPVKDQSRLHLFLAPYVTPTGKKAWDVTEEIEVVLMPIAVVREQIFSGQIRVAGSLAALLLGLEKMAQLNGDK
ncbi:NUDIX hydrolase [Synechocystis sp. FACHB-383]|uniref:NUDIX hydrolase n=1 Tax=Synechocystis sp. FACHB-383 TaxID=2692864 RepID=UPI00168246EC|nr:NUDIX hydrolase [Synechocystis sp. FACHB-383]MBD2653026.1 NUDIX hydrolase [Synechocystis sp. FACHB-383]